MDGQGKKELVYLHDFPALSWVHAHVGTVRLRKKAGREGERGRESETEKVPRRREDRPISAPTEVHVL